MKRRGFHAHLVVRWIVAVAGLLIGLWFFILPGLILTGDLLDPALRTGAIPAVAWRLSRHLSPIYARWAGERAKADSRATSVSGTEWPLFGSVFYLEALDSLQDAWLKNPKSSATAPAVYGRDAIGAAAALVTQPGQAKWVQNYWGANYQHHEDLFYRYLLISAMVSYTKLTGDPKYLAALRDQVESLSAELARSPAGLLEDYPNQCYPTDVIGAIGAIREADSLLHTDQSDFLRKSLRAFTGPVADSHGLPGYQAEALTGTPLQPSRGCGTSFALIVTPGLWPEKSAAWYASYVDNFWQERDGLAGFREFSRDTAGESADVDSGPVILGYGVAASAFGVGAARAQGDLKRAAPLTAEMLAASWPLPDGTLLIPRLLSDAVDAPSVGEASILYCLTRPVPEGSTPATTVTTPFVWLALLFYFACGLFFLLPVLMLVGVRSFGRTRTRPAFSSMRPSRFLL